VKVIYKYLLPAPLTTIALPLGARLLHVHEQYGEVCLWAEVDSNVEKLEERTFVWIGTGNGFPENGTYLGTAHARHFVWHIYEVQP
jgi:hypothetical protein